MEYVLSALLLHKLGKSITEANVKNVLQAAGANVNENKVKALIAALEGVDIEKAIAESALMQVAAAPAGEAKAEKKEEKKEEKVSEEVAAAGLGALFG